MSPGGFLHISLIFNNMVILKHAIASNLVFFFYVGDIYIVGGKNQYTLQKFVHLTFKTLT